MSTLLGVQITLGLGYVVGSILWPRFYYPRLDPALRGWLGDKLGVRIVWAIRPGGFNKGPLWFGPLYDTWAWSIEGGQQRTMLQEALVYTAWVVLVPVLCGLGPVALFLAAFLAAEGPSILVAYPLLFLTIPIYARYWSGKYEVPGMRSTHAPATEQSG